MSDEPGGPRDAPARGPAGDAAAIPPRAARREAAIPAGAGGSAHAFASAPAGTVQGYAAAGEVAATGPEALTTAAEALTTVALPTTTGAAASAGADEAPIAGQTGEPSEQGAPSQPFLFDRPHLSRRTDARTIVALAGPILFTPAALFLVDRPAEVLGVPFLLVYIFAVWLAGIALTFILARRAR